MAEAQSGRQTKGPHFVEDLADEADYWLTITDAARVRRQEVTIHRWVATGTLPARRQAVGLNQRTCHVRARLTPIIDTGVTAQVDLLSIPAQQAQILATHAILQHDLDRMQTQFVQDLAQFHQHVAKDHADAHRTHRPVH